jgi:hypothetical protein
MTARDRIVLMAVIVLVILGAGWMLVVSPERDQASSLSAQVTSAKTALATAEGELTKARAAQSQYSAAYDSIVGLGKAVPASDEVPSLIYELAKATEQKHVFFSSISSSGGSGSAAASAAAAAGAPAAFTALPFSFVFDGSFFNLEELFRKLTSLTTRTPSGALKVSGRLLTIQSVSLSPGGTGSSSASSNQLTGDIGATAYVLPGGQTVTGATGAAAPAGATPASTTTGASSSSATAPATVTVTP